MLHQGGPATGALGSDPHRLRRANRRRPVVAVGPRSHQNGLADGAALDQIDVQDEEKIVGHVFGGNTDGVVNRLGAMSGSQTSSLVRKLLPILAPIVLSWLAKQVVGGSTATPGQSTPGQPNGPLGQGRATTEDPTEQRSTDLTSVLQDVLGSALGSATGTGSSGSSGGILGDVPGGILGRR
ncbi:hypothetical protein BJF80_12360 [Serinicoccus sp. CUA-874]|nr:hypothetical protein BJF80_12360 [Serinicoccus sp. CUA-874]